MEAPRRYARKSPEFFRELADLITSRPTRHRSANVVAERYGVPITIAQSWIRQARHFGYLPNPWVTCERCGLPYEPHREIYENEPGVDHRMVCIRLLRIEIEKLRNGAT